MEILDPNTEIKKKKLPPETVFSLQGSVDKAFIVLHSGIAEILINDAPPEEAAPEEIILGSVRTGFIKGETLIGYLDILNVGSGMQYSLRTMTECQVSSRPMSHESLTKKMQSDVTLNLKIHRSLLSRIESAFYLFRNYKYLWHKVASIADSMALGCPLEETGTAAEAAGRRSSSMKEYSAYLKKLASDSGEGQPGLWDYNLFLGRTQDRLDLYAAQDANVVEDHIDMKQYVFIKRLLKKKDEAVSAVLHRDEPLNRYILDFLGSALDSMLGANRALIGETKDLMQQLYGDNGWLNELIGQAKADHRPASNFLHFMAKFSLRFRKDAINLLGLDPMDQFPDYAALGRYREFREETEKADVSRTSDVGGLEKYDGLLQKILEFGDVSQDFRDEFTGLIDYLAEGHELRSPERIGAMFWELYEKCFLKIVGTDLKGFIPGIMLHLGVIDERLLSDQNLMAVDACYRESLYSDETIPAMTLPYFLEKIYKGEVEPSVTEMGDSFKFVLNSQKKLTPKEREKTYIFESNHDDLVRFELRKVAGEIQGMIFGNRRKALPFLMDSQIQGSPVRMFLSPDAVVANVEKYRQRDFSMFYREVMLRHELGSDFIQAEVIPNFVLYPGFGSRAVMWQEMDGTRKRTPGRIILPAFFSETIGPAILEQIAYFRWELQKAVSGHNWTDPVEGGIVGAYYDYIAFYKKNSTISPEARKRLADFIKRTKSDKDRFSKDYITWVEYEFNGSMRLNGAAREIFFRFCPFPAAVRKEMGQKPTFSTMATRFRNRRAREITRMESKEHKYRKKNKPLPAELAAYVAFLKS